jgi:DHA1 family inner membrane transport protein
MTQKKRVAPALFALALGGFGLGLTEFVAMGLIPQLAADLLPEIWVGDPERATAQAGWLISAYALGVVVGAPTIAALSARFPRRALLLWCVGVFTFGSVASALSPTFELVLVSRFVAGLPHGAYFGIAALVAARLMGPGRRGVGVAVVLSGLTLANVVGVPTATFVGQTFGWRSAYVVVTVVFVLAFTALAATLPHQAGDPTATLRRELGALRRGQVWLALLTGAIGFGGLFAVYTYVAPMVTEVAGLGEGVVPWALVAIGLGMTLGNVLGGAGSDRHVGRTMMISFGVLALGLVGVALGAHWAPALFAALFVTGAAASALSPAIQTRLMDVAGDSQTLAAAINHAALNIGNSLGAWLGGITIAAGLGYLSPAWVGLALCVGGVVFAVISLSLPDGVTRAERSREPVAH